MGPRCCRCGASVGQKEQPRGTLRHFGCCRQPVFDWNRSLEYKSVPWTDVALSEMATFIANPVLQVQY